jgi:hypothetical protein
MLRVKGHVGRRTVLRRNSFSNFCEDNILPFRSNISGFSNYHVGNALPWRRCYFTKFSTLICFIFLSRWWNYLRYCISSASVNAYKFHRKNLTQLSNCTEVQFIIITPWSVKEAMEKRSAKWEFHVSVENYPTFTNCHLETPLPTMDGKLFAFATFLILHTGMWWILLS